MGDEFDVDDLLEAPYKVKNDPEIAPFFATTKSAAISICIVLTQAQLRCPAEVFSDFLLSGALKSPHIPQSAPSADFLLLGRENILNEPCLLSNINVYVVKISQNTIINIFLLG
eukprot:TRINITY_DN2872_c0_g1_i2.p3 TRINITY_DN2872_c0_g1~~TRINITY_DN2872_c0_g1_i2.p3  ORF type:complete len:114 (-),score=0.71 TRINITY_DN2872_c0_g1_i2:1018-1359(-)